MPSRNVPAQLPMWEQTLYWTTESFTIFYMLYSIYHSSLDAMRKNEPIQLEEGWAWIGRPMDTTDFEWGFWTSFFWDVLPWLCGQAVLSCLLTWSESSIKTKAVVNTLYSILALIYLLGIYTVLCLSLQPVILYLVSMFGSAAIVWVTTFAFLTILNMSETTSTIVQLLPNRNSDGDFGLWYYLFVFIWANICQRATAFALECAWVQQSQTVTVSSPKKTDSDSPADAADSTSRKSEAPSSVGWSTLEEAPTWLDMLFYVFYLPLFFTGPLVVYYNFHRQAREPQPCTWKRLRSVILQLVRITFWAVLNFVMLHFIYAHAINGSSSTLSKQSLWSVAATGYVCGQFFMVKYLVLFGGPAQLARLDGFEPPAVPACVSYIYCYSDMWKSFDRGLYDFMKRYIFIPCGGSRAGLGQQVLSSMLCFAYIFYWHGAEYFLFMWCVLNFVEICLEQVGAWLENTVFVRTYFYNNLSPVGIRRVRAVMSVPVFLMSVFAIFYFFGGADSGVVYLQKMFIESSWDGFSVFLLLIYVAVQNAMEIERLGLTKLRVSSDKE